MFGVNRDYYDAFSAAVPGARAVRIYYDALNVFPAQWPDRLPGAWVTLSIRPHPRDLLRGRLDSRLEDLVATAPARSELTIWHAAGPGNPLAEIEVDGCGAVRAAAEGLWAAMRAGPDRPSVHGRVRAMAGLGVGEVVSTQVLSVREGAPAKAVAAMLVLLRNDSENILVTDEGGRLVGTISALDILFRDKPGPR